MREVYILSGPNGAGISSARFVFEELGFYVIENVPVNLTSSVLDTLGSYQVPPSKILLITSIRDAKKVYDEVKKHQEVDLNLIIVTCNKDELLKRFTLTRHTHPSTVALKISLENAIDLDLKCVEDLLDYAIAVIDTTNMALVTLRSQLFKILTKGNDKITVTFISYGLKYGAPKGLDASFDVRIIPNPYWIEGLRELNGTNEKIKQFLLSFPITSELIDSIEKYLQFYLPHLSVKDRKDYTVGICCSGGHHRSTFVANELAERFKNKYQTSVIHRDCPEINNE